VKILLTGRTGQLGWHLTHLLPRLGETLSTDRASLDLTQPDSLRAAIRAMRPDVIVNAAAYTAVDRAESEKGLAHAINATAPGIMAEEAERLGALLVHYSSDYVFDGTSQKPYLESDAPNPINAYGRSKLAGEGAIAAAGGAHLVLRTSWLYDMRGSNFVLTMLRLAKEREELRVVDDQIGSPTWARAVAEATLELLNDLPCAKKAAGVYHLSARGSVNRYEFTRRLLALTGAPPAHATRPRVLPIKTVDFPSAATRPLNCVLDNTRMKKTFGVALPDWEAQLCLCLAAGERVEG
jgi:dTDP-4-dehydrorhamnose reductase